MKYDPLTVLALLHFHSQAPWASCLSMTSQTVGSLFFFSMLGQLVSPQLMTCLFLLFLLLVCHLFLFSPCAEKSFDNIKTWIRNIEQHASEDVEKMILGNKCDMEDKRVVSTEQGQQLAQQFGVAFMETSAKSNINVEEAFMHIARAIKKKMDNKVVAPGPSPGGKSGGATVVPTSGPTSTEQKKGFFSFCSVL